MDKRKKIVLGFLFLIGLIVGLVSNPQESKAFTYSYPAETIYVKILNRYGKEITSTLPTTMEANHVTGLYNGGSASVLSANPLSITRVPGTNTYAFHIPAVNYTLSSGWYFSYLSNIKMNHFPTTFKGFTGKSASVQLLNDALGTTTINQIGGTMQFTTHNNLDGTWNIYLGVEPYPFPAGYEFNASAFGQRQMNMNASGTFKAYAVDGDYLGMWLMFPQVKEIYEDESGSSIPAPAGYTNDNYVDIVDKPFNYQLANDSGLPKTYTDSGFIYTYKGWYKGAGKQSNMDTNHPPTINFNADADLKDAENEVHVVYNKRALRTVDEEYIDTSSGTIEPSWNNTGQQFADGDTFTQTPAATKTDSSGAIWEYQGWKLGTEPMSAMRPESTPVSVSIDANKTIQYVYKKKQHTITEKWVDQVDGATLVPLSVNPKTSSMDDNDHFTGTATTPLTDTHGGIWDFVGWENVTDASGVINAAPAYAVNNIKGSKEILYHYKARNTTATLDLNPTPKVVMSGGNVAWSSRLTNTGTSTLNNLKLKATSNWAAGLSHPTQVTVTPAGGSPQNFTVAPGDWTSGFSLTGINIPNSGPNNYADITFTDTATGAVNQVLPAEIEIDGNMASPLKAENFVRIDDPDEPNLEPTGNAGLINLPDFHFGEVEVKPYAQTKGLDAASYESGYNPYIRYMDNESTGVYSLAVKMSPFASGSKTLPATTSIKLKDGVMKEVQNYNKHNESLSAGSSIGPLTIYCDNTTSIIHFGNTQGVYQLDYAFNDVELDLMAHSGVAGLNYTATMDWTLTTAP